MHAFQDPTLLTQFNEAFKGHPFLSAVGLTPVYLAWTGLWVLLALALAAVAFQRRDL